jgi:hypothetical protein
MTPAPNFEASCELLRELDITIEEARSTPESFGSWFIRATAKGKLIRIVWDGRDGALIIQEPSPRGAPSDWGDRWIAGNGYARKTSELREGVLLVLDS